MTINTTAITITDTNTANINSTTVNCTFLNVHIYFCKKYEKWQFNCLLIIVSNMAYGLYFISVGFWRELIEKIKTTVVTDHSLENNRSDWWSWEVIYGTNATKKKKKLQKHAPLCCSIRLHSMSTEKCPLSQSDINPQGVMNYVTPILSQLKMIDGKRFSFPKNMFF